MVISEKEVIVRLVVAFLMGGIIGIERQFRNKHAGIRTYALISLASCLFTISSIRIIDIYQIKEPLYVVSAVALGIGFIGSGMIYKEPSLNIIRGLTSAAVLWLTSAIGLTIGLGYFYTAGTVFVLTLIALFGVRILEFKVGLKKQNK